ncbi:glycosyltransferase family 2 protein [Pedobacter punctiformis]|uniref:Glycosyltransferase family 2 protein n=1 Tax=Pedobacter punctiformis TaxID=3004097 RepID=A0ABT4L4T3_9SPHI|nr:glycosyltransferase family 2 protein [Pedobacter sp. HCMS5-2]MCZ4242917.1 glycosyltransferase family 2 protein [Pedobacter sp. HCMS5-2]
MMCTNNREIAILLAAYNAEKYLSEQIESIIAQTFTNWTLYIRNDGSTDQTAVVISDYCIKYPDKIFEIDKGGKNLGCRNNFFRLLEVVESEYYMFCDADDVWLKSKIEFSYERIKMLELLNPYKAILVHTDAIICDSDLNIISDSFWHSTGINPMKFTSFNYMCVCCTVGGAKSIFNRKAKELIFPLADNNFMFDYWIALNVAKYGIISVIDVPLIKYRQHSSNLLGVTYGNANSIFNKLKQAKTLFRDYKRESDTLKTIGYGSFTKYLFYKFLVVVKTRFTKY